MNALLDRLAVWFVCGVIGALLLIAGVFFILATVEQPMLLLLWAWFGLFVAALDRISRRDL